MTNILREIHILESFVKGKDSTTNKAIKQEAMLHDDYDLLPSESTFNTPKQKTINAVDKYTQSEEFKAVSKDKQEAILSLKNIEPAPMPENIRSKRF